MQFVDNHKLNRGQMLRVAFLGEQHGETLRSRHENVRAVTAKLRAVGCGGIAGAKMDAQLFFESHPDNWGAQIFLDVVGKRAQRRNVNAAHAGRCRSCGRRAPTGVTGACYRTIDDIMQEVVEYAKKSGEGFAAAGRRGEENRFAVQNCRDAELLCVGEIAKVRAEPGTETRVQPPFQRVRLALDGRPLVTATNCHGPSAHF